MKAMLLSILIFQVSLVANAKSAVMFGSAKSTSAINRGLVSVYVFSGYEQSRLLNQAGDYSRLKGYDFGAGLEIGLWSNGGGEVRLFGQSLSASDSGEQSTGDLLTRSETLYGLKFYPNQNLFVAGGIGQESLKFKNSTSEQNLSAKISAIGGGVEFDIGANALLGVSAWYKSGPLTKQENSSLVTNSFFESAEAQLSLSWSPQFLNSGRP